MTDTKNSTPASATLDSASRRTVLGVAGATGLALMLPTLARAQSAGTLKVGFVSPRTGPLGSFGEGDPYVLDLARKSLANGVTIAGKKYAVEILDRDTQSDPARASQLAKTLINSDKIDLMLTTSTPEVVNPVSDACEAAGVPCIATVMPWEAWYFGRGAKPGQPSPFKWSYLFSFGVADFVKSYLSQWAQVPNNKKVAALLPNDADGNAIRAAMLPDLTKAGYTVVDGGRYETGTTDFSAQIAKFKEEHCEILLTFPIPPDFATFWRQSAQQGLTKQMKVVQVAKTGLFASTIEVLGPLGYNISVAAYWHKNFPYKSTLTGVSGVELADGYEKGTGKQWNQQLGATLSLLDVGFAALAASSDPRDKAAVAKAISSLKTQTMMGQIDFAKGPVPNVSPTAMIGAQWIKAPAGSKFKYEYVITENASDPTVPVAHKLIPYAS
ncbi:ABC transporter substrate-binding protein [Pararobbsia silviterrae]|uniref:ABC transporter substrate-binding protein n=1 Tax=Pararobbsia silviterrae TaxID=1792498 RepID=A0A494XRV0_9BURK|nr:ABC transporter substrate-binding protein [Pararobbsia silviterrae]RKP53360.1 ABC transporter substrate-binding protein [Pararobbsia silviterrae]